MLLLGRERAVIHCSLDFFFFNISSLEMVNNFFFFFFKDSWDISNVSLVPVSYSVLSSVLTCSFTNT